MQYKPYLNHIRNALAPYHLHSQVPLTEESTALVRSKCIPGVTETGHNTMKKIKELTTQNDANERKKSSASAAANTASKNKFNNFTQRSYDYDELEQMLLTTNVH